MKNVNIDALLADLSRVPWNIMEVFNDVHDASDTWQLLFDDVINKHCPLKKIRVSKKKSNQKWYNDYIDALRNARDRAHVQAIQTNDVEHWKLYKKIKNQTNNKILLAKKNFYKTSIEDAKCNSKKMWSVLKDLLPKCKVLEYPVWS